MSDEDDKKYVLPIYPAVMDYAWGIRGLDSRVARYALESGVIDEVDPDAPYAELWIGTHSKVYTKYEMLLFWIAIDESRACYSHSNRVHQH